MAFERADLIADPFPSSHPVDLAAESTALRIRRDAPLESGIPAARAQGERTLAASEEHLELALAGVARTEANLGQLLRGLKHLYAGAGAAREANNELMTELEELRAHLARSQEAELALRYRMSQLEQLLELVRHDAAREREFLIDQQDRFLVEIMTDHDRQVADIRRSLPAPLRTPAVDQIAELTAQRDQAREYALRCERERDAAWQALAGEKVPTVTRDLDEGDTLRPAPTAIASVTLRAVKFPAPSKIPSAVLPEAERPSSLSGTSYSLPGSGDDSE